VKDKQRILSRPEAAGICVRVGMEATGYSRWFERLLAELGSRYGSATQRRSRRSESEAEDRREDARLMRKLLLENRFPRIWVPDPENRDLRQLLWHRHRWCRWHANHESTAGASITRATAGGKNVQRTRTSAVREALVSSLGQSAPARVVGAVDRMIDH